MHIGFSLVSLSLFSSVLLLGLPFSVTSSLRKRPGRLTLPLTLPLAGSRQQQQQQKQKQLMVPDNNQYASECDVLSDGFSLFALCLAVRMLSVVRCVSFSAPREVPLIF